MSSRLMHDARGRALPGLAPPATSATDRQVGDINADHAALLPSPGMTVVAAGAGGTLGFATVSYLAARHVDPFIGLTVIGALFAIAMIGLKSLTDARTESGRAVAVMLNALALGATLAGLKVLL